MSTYGRRCVAPTWRSGSMKAPILRKWSSGDFNLVEIRASTRSEFGSTSSKPDRTSSGRRCCPRMSRSLGRFVVRRLASRSPPNEGWPPPTGRLNALHQLRAQMSSFLAPSSRHAVSRSCGALDAPCRIIGSGRMRCGSTIWPRAAEQNTGPGLPDSRTPILHLARFPRRAQGAVGSRHDERLNFAWPSVQEQASICRLPTASSTPARRDKAAAPMSTPGQNLTLPPVENLTVRRGDEPQVVATS